MKPLFVFLLLIGWLSSGCSVISEKAKMEEYGRIIDSYETAMRVSDLNALCHFVDPAVMSRQACHEKYEGLKIVDYRVNHIDVAPDRTVVRQEVEMDFYYLNSYVLETIAFEQSWKYFPESKKWLLQNEPPNFE